MHKAAINFEDAALRVVMTILKDLHLPKFVTFLRYIRLIEGEIHLKEGRKEYQTRMIFLSTDTSNQQCILTQRRMSNRQKTYWVNKSCL